MIIEQIVNDDESDQKPKLKQYYVKKVDKTSWESIPKMEIDGKLN